MSITNRLDGLASGAAIKVPARVASTGNLTLSGLQTVDGVVLASGDRVLALYQTDATEGGIWVADTGDWDRAKDFDGNNDVVDGTLLTVVEGSVNARTAWRVTTADQVEVGTDNITFEAALFDDASVLYFIAAGTGAVQRSVQDKERDFLSVFDFMTTAQKADVMAGTATINCTAAIQAAHDAALTLGYKKVVYPGGTYLCNTGFGFSPYICHESLGQVVFQTPLASGTFIHVSTQYGEHASPYNLKHSKTIVFIGQWYMENTTGANTATAFYVGDVPASSTYYAHLTSFFGVEVWKFDTDITYGTNAFDVEWHSCFFFATITRSINVLSTATNSGENMRFISCTFGGGTGVNNAGSVLRPNNVNGWDIQFIGCVFAYRSMITEAVAATLTTLNMFGCHFEWDGANTLFNHTGGVTNNVKPFFYSTSATKANPFIAAVGAATVHDVQGALYIMPTGAAVTSMYTGSSTSSKIITDYAPNILGGTLPTAQRVDAAGTAYIGFHGIEYDANSYTGTLTGGTTAPTGTVYITRVGNTVQVDIPVFTVTSNATSKTITGMPSRYFPATLKRGTCLIQDNGGAVTVAAFSIETTGVITIYAGPGFNSWTAAGTATIYAFECSYTAN